MLPLVTLHGPPPPASVTRTGPPASVLRAAEPQKAVAIENAELAYQMHLKCAPLQLRGTKCKQLRAYSHGRSGFIS